MDVPDSRYDIKVKRSDRSLYSRGIYLREPLDAGQATSHIVDVTPRLKEVIPSTSSSLQLSHSAEARIQSLGVKANI